MNFRVDPDLVQALLPSSLEPITRNGTAIVGICLIGLRNLRPKGLPSMMGLSSENMAHRVAVRYPAVDGKKDGVFIWRRETDQRLVSLLGGRLFPGVHGHADFAINEGQSGLSMKVSTRKGEADVGFQADYETDWKPTPAFSSFQDAREFFERGDCGFSCSLQDGRLDGMRLQTFRWDMKPLRISDLHSVFYEDGRDFPSGAARFDCGLIMQGIPHEWHELPQIAY